MAENMRLNAQDERARANSLRVQLKYAEKQLEDAAIRSSIQRAALGRDIDILIAALERIEQIEKYGGSPYVLKIVRAALTQVRDRDD